MKTFIFSAGKFFPCFKFFNQQDFNMKYMYSYKTMLCYIFTSHRAEVKISRKDNGTQPKQSPVGKFPVNKHWSLASRCYYQPITQSFLSILSSNLVTLSKSAGSRSYSIVNSLIKTRQFNIIDNLLRFRSVMIKIYHRIINSSNLLDLG